jgi:DNA recombination protein RmuC
VFWRDIAKTQLRERESAFEKQLQQFEEQKEHLKKEFELLAHKIFEQKGQAFEERSKTNLTSVLQPFKEQIEGFQKRVNQVHSESVQGQTKLEEQIKSVLDVGLKMSDEANTLASALKGDKKAQGTWSEVQAELLLEMAGLSEGREYRREASFKSDDGRDQRPDFIIQLPNDKHIILDSKISLNAYVQATGAETDDERQAFLRLHVEAIRNHVKSLSDKNYPKLKGVNSPEYVFMFVGNEPAYLAAAEFDPNLFQEAYRKGIAIVTPNTLLSSLRIVSHLWSIDKQNSNTRRLAEQASKVYDKLRVFVTKMEKLGTQLNTVQKSYDDTWNTLKGGRGSLTRQVDGFVEMGVSVKEKLPASVTENGDLSLDSDSE